MTTPRMIELNPENPPAPLTDEARADIAALARRQRRAGGVLMKGILFVGGQVEDGMKFLPAPLRSQIEGAARNALRHSYDLAAKSRGEGVAARIAGDRVHKIMATLSGALGGLGGLATALAELPVATTVIFRAVQGVAAAHEETRLECLRVFGSGGPQETDEGIDTSFVGARLSLSGAAVQKLIARVAPHFAAVMSQKLASQTIPVLGAAAGAGTNYAFMAYYVEMAHVHFGLHRLIRQHGEEAVLGLFHKIAAEGRVPVKVA
jgi:hypothetical protein